MPDAFITATSSVLPGPAIGNDAIEQVLGRVGNDPSRLKNRILKNNGILQRHYAIDPATGLPTHTTAGLAADAIRGALGARGLGLDDIDLLACATSIPEHLMPGHASMVHGELGAAPCEIASLHGVCSAGISALKYATLAVKAGGARNAVVSGAERTSMVLRSGAFRAELAARTLAEEEDPYLGFNQEFLRWMLSDGAGACVVQDRPLETGLSLKVEFVELVSFANELPVCMYMGGDPTASGGLVGWRDGESMEAGIRGGVLNIHQDVKLLGKHIVNTCARALDVVRKKHRFTADDATWFLPHYSSEFFRDKTHDALVLAGFEIPYERWCSNLVQRGNTGCASSLIMLDDFLASGRLQKGDGVVLLVPESGRFSCGWALLRAV
jgi:3-oxoacyl-[acyl-carrier-protein] synthase-3